MIRDWLLHADLIPSSRGCFLLLQIELLQLLVDLLGIEVWVSCINLGHFTGSVRKDDALQLLLLQLFVMLLSILHWFGRCTCHWIHLLWELFGLNLIEKVAVLSLHAVH